MKKIATVGVIGCVLMLGGAVVEARYDCGGVAMVTATAEHRAASAAEAQEYHQIVIQQQQDEILKMLREQRSRCNPYPGGPMPCGC
jgi:hypothetical protein